MAVAGADKRQDRTESHHDEKQHGLNTSQNRELSYRGTWSYFPVVLMGDILIWHDQTL